MEELSKTAEYILWYACSIYNQRLTSRPNMPNIRHFMSDFYQSDKRLSGISKDEINLSLAELKQKGYIRLYIRGNFTLLQPGIIYIKNKPKRLFREIFDCLKQLNPLK